jgi:transcriptional regulator with XRE-family HTH domain
MNAPSATALADRTRPARIGDHLRQWRQRRHLSQLDLAVDAEISARHLSFVETGRAAPSRDMVMRLAERLEVPLRERNAAGSGGICAGVSAALARRSRAEAGASRDRSGAESA